MACKVSEKNNGRFLRYLNTDGLTDGKTIRQKMLITMEPIV